MLFSYTNERKPTFSSIIENSLQWAREHILFLKIKDEKTGLLNLENVEITRLNQKNTNDWIERFPVFLGLKVKVLNHQKSMVVTESLPL